MPEEVDDLIRKDFEDMPQHLYQDKYRDLLTKYVAYLEGEKHKPNSIRAWVSSVRSFFASEAGEIKLQTNRLPDAEMASNEHDFTLDEFRAMYAIADLEGKARLSTALSLGWSVGDILAMDPKLVEQAVGNVDSDGYGVFDAHRLKTGGRARAILNPCAVKDLRKYLATRPRESTRLWTIGTDKGLNKWLLMLIRKAGLKTTGQVRFHLIRKYVYDLASSRCGENEAKLLVGKKIPMSDATSLHGLQARLLSKYKDNLYNFVSLNRQRLRQEEKGRELSEKLEAQTKVLDYLQSENVELKARLRRVEEMEERLQRLEIEAERFKKLLRAKSLI
jgi:hypothetical protein